MKRRAIFVPKSSVGSRLREAISEGLLGEQRGCSTASSAGLVRTEPGRVHLLDDGRREATKHVVGLARGERPWLSAGEAGRSEGR